MQLKLSSLTRIPWRSEKGEHVGRKTQKNSALDPQLAHSDSRNQQDLAIQYY